MTTATKRTPTPAQAKVLSFLIESIDNGWNPTMDAISGEFGWASRNAAHRHIIGLAKKGLVERRGNQYPIRVTPLGMATFRKPIREV
jgi:SOS-response transcriptional repressor LexA